MKQTLLQEKYPVFHLELPNAETSLATVDAVILALRDKIDREPSVADISVFDHYAHTKSFGGETRADIVAAKNLVFCLGCKLPDPRALAVRPRSIGVVDCGDRFVISFLEASMEIATKKMEALIEGLADRKAA